MSKRSLKKIFSVVLSFMIAFSFFLVPPVSANDGEVDNEVVVENETGTAVQIQEKETPYAQYKGHWSVISLGLIIAMSLTAFMEGRITKFSENKKARNLSWVLVLISGVIFIVGSNFSGGANTFVDVSTLVIITLFILQTNILLKSKKIS